jgi:hypothetical protein
MVMTVTIRIGLFILMHQILVVGVIPTVMEWTENQKIVLME